MNLLNNCDEVSSSSSKTTNNFNNLINSTTAEPPQPQPQRHLYQQDTIHQILYTHLTPNPL